MYVLTDDQRQMMSAALAERGKDSRRAKAAAAAAAATDLLGDTLQQQQHHHHHHEEKNPGALAHSAAAAAAAADAHSRPETPRSRKGHKKKNRNSGNKMPLYKGKGVWDEIILRKHEHFDEALDRNDPNFDSEDESLSNLRLTPILDSLEGYKQSVSTVLVEFFSSCDVSEVKHCLEELGMPGFHYSFVKKAIVGSLDHPARAKELVAGLLSHLARAGTIDAMQIEKGLQRTLDGVHDLVLDVPKAADDLIIFVARAKLEGFLSSSFFRREDDASEEARQIKASALEAVATKKGELRVLEAWGGPGLRRRCSVSECRSSMMACIATYLESGNLEDCREQLRALSVPYFHHEFVHLTLGESLGNPVYCRPLMSLLGELNSSGVISDTQLSTGLRQVFQDMKDLAKGEEDNDRIRQLISDAVQGGWGSLSELDVFATCGLAAAKEEGEAAAKEEVAREEEEEDVDPASAILRLKEFKLAVTQIVREYFESGDKQEAIECLRDAWSASSSDSWLPYVIHRLILAAIDRSDRERELAAQLMPALVSSASASAAPPPLFSPLHVVQGFRLILSSFADLTLDAPAALEHVSKFLARSVVDEVVAPVALEELRAEFELEAGGEVVSHARLFLRARHAAERVLAFWGGAGSGSLQHTKEEYQKMLKEFASSHDQEELVRRLRGLNKPFYHHEFVKSTLVYALEEGKADKDVLLMSMLRDLAAMRIISLSQLEMGVQRVRDRLDDLTLDVPGAASKFAALQVRLQPSLEGGSTLEEEEQEQQ